LALALVIFSLFFPRVGERVHHHTRHYPKLHAAIVRMEDWVRRTIGEI
jgi:preprotein translocase subunit Sec63